MMLKRGSKGEEVRSLQKRMIKLGYDIDSDGDFGPKTETAVKELQSAFGYTVDGIVGEGTNSLIDQQLGYGWNAKAPDAKQRALAAQGKAPQPSMAKATNANPPAKS